MKQRWIWFIVVITLICIGFMWAWRPAWISRIYRTFVPVGEIRTNQVRGINGIGFRETNPNEFDFYVAGHIYGAPEIKDHQPDSALLAAIPSITKTSPDLFVLLGDMVEQSDKQEFDILDLSLLNQLAFPIFNTVGNHDVANRALYEARYGNTFFTFKYGPARMIFLDTEKVECSLDDTQTLMLSTALQHAQRDQSVQYVFIFMHKTLFLNNEFLIKEKAQLATPNEQKCYHSKKFIKLMDELIIPAASQKLIYLFAGDVGAWGNLTPYYEQQPNVSLTMIMTGLGDTSRDNILHVHVDESQVKVDVLFLSEMTSQPLENFGPAYWQDVATGKIQFAP